MKKQLAQIRLIAQSGLPALSVMPLIAESIREMMPCLSMSYIKLNDECRPEEYYAEHFNEKTHKLFCHRGDQLTAEHDDPASFKMLFAIPTDFGSLLAPPPMFYQSSTYLHFFQPNGIYHVMDMKLKKEGKPLAMAAIFREKSSSGFSAKEKQVLPLLHRYFQHLANAPEASIDAFVTDEELGTAALVADQQGNIVMASPCAVELLQLGLPCNMRHEIGNANISQICQLLSHRAHGKSQATDQNTAQYSINIPSGRLTLRGYRMEGYGSYQNGLTNIHITHSVPAGITVWKNLMETGLSTREKEVAWLMTQQHDENTICQEMGIKPSTFHTYVKHLHREFAVNSHSALVARLQQSSGNMSGIEGRFH